MKVSELIEELKQMPQDLEVFCMCDHGQTPERSMAPTIYYIDTDDHDDYTDDEEDAESYGYSKTIVLL